MFVAVIAVWRFPLLYRRLAERSYDVVEDVTVCERLVDLVLPYDIVERISKCGRIDVGDA